MATLLDLEPTKISRDLTGKIILLYGKEKSGKTSTAAKFPGALILAFERGYHALDNVYAYDIDTWAGILDAVKQLEKPEVKAKFKTVVIDTVGIAYDKCEQHICTINQVPEISKIPYGQGWVKTEKEFNRVLRHIISLGYGLVMIAHAEVKTLTDELTKEEVEKIQPKLNARAKYVVNSVSDAIIYIRSITNNDGSGFTSTAYCRATERIDAGSRWRYMPSQFEFSYESLVRVLIDAVDKQAQMDGAVVTNDYVNDYEQRGIPFAELKDKALALCKSLVEKSENKDEIYESIQKIIHSHLGEDGSLTVTTPEQYEYVQLIYGMLLQLQK